MKLSFHKYALSLLASLVLVSCAKDYALVGTEREKGREPIWLSTSVMVQTPRAAGAVSNDPISSTTDDGESRIVSLRMIISDSKTGIIVYNEKEDNPQELTERYTQYNSPDARWRRPIKILPGTYDFWFIANEGSNWYARLCSPTKMELRLWETRCLINSRWEATSSASLMEISEAMGKHRWRIWILLLTNQETLEIVLGNPQLNAPCRCLRCIKTLKSTSRATIKAQAKQILSTSLLAVTKR